MWPLGQKICQYFLDEIVLENVAVQCPVKDFGTFVIGNLTFSISDGKTRYLQRFYALLQFKSDILITVICISQHSSVKQKSRYDCGFMIKKVNLDLSMYNHLILRQRFQNSQVTFYQALFSGL